ncbi:hypothetical protein AQUCO_02600114v1 [Aquilegia coerulea]|uniref:Peroxidase n=1 Tax=Aquilegia coerulea TaxID=218851 RepID=A0A2G5D7E9_AQUCA|nr:hypothetical protein AQUCO_02600114v1 [Aquilegia coerulea]
MRSSFYFCCVTLVVLALIEVCTGAGLKLNFYCKTCPQFEKIVKNITWSRVASDPRMGAKLLRVHYHDCFVRGCDASLLLDSTSTNVAEKEARPNLSVLGFDVIDDIKTRLEEECPETVSCADIVALAARDAVSFQYKRPMWKVWTGRRDGNISLATEANNDNLPSASSNFTTLRQLFARKGLSVMDLVALSGAHTIGVSHCGVLGRRLFNFTGKGDVDPSIEPSYAEILRTKCSSPTRETTIDMDPESSLSFDSHYYRILNQKKGLFQSDAALLNNPISAKLTKLLQRPNVFFTYFARSMRHMGAIDVLTGKDGEIRKQCRVPNA